MQNVLVVVDMQKDFVDGALGTAEAVAIVPYLTELVRGWQGPVLFTQDTHQANYMQTQEGQHLPVPHCIEGSAGWQLIPQLEALRQTEPIRKLTFGAKDLPRRLQELEAQEPLGSVTFVGLCTDICVISNAMLVKAFFPELPLRVDAQACAGVTPASHQNALQAMQTCQIEILHG